MFALLRQFAARTGELDFVDRHVEELAELVLLLADLGLLVLELVGLFA